MMIKSYREKTDVMTNDKGLVITIYEHVNEKQFERVNEAVGNAKKFPIAKYNKLINELAKEVDKFIENGYNIYVNSKVCNYYLNKEFAEVEAEKTALELIGRRK